MRFIPLLVAASVITACSLVSPRDPPKTAFDFGPLSTTPLGTEGADQPLVVSEITAPAWLEDSSMYYRLMYRNADNPLPYRGSSWVMPPAALLTMRLRANLSPPLSEIDDQTERGSVRSYLLSGELLEFEQVFDASNRSRGVLRLRATLDDGKMSAQRVFLIEEPAPTPDARGGVSALIRCSDELARQIIDWLAITQRDSRRSAQD